MSQQINLLDPSLLPRRDWLSPAWVGAMLLGVVGVLIAAAVFGWLREAQEREHFAAAERRLRDAQSQLTSLAAQQSRQIIDPALQGEVALVEQVLSAKEEVVQVLDRGALGERKGFSAYMYGFARQGVEGVWLTGFDLSAGRNTLEVRGRMRQESLLPRFVQQLNQEPVFQGRRFAALDMKRLDTPKMPPVAGEQALTVNPQNVVEFVLLGDPPKAEGAR